MILEKTHKLTLYNDDEHTHEYVAACLIKLCDHEIIQALQCATIVDNVGKHDVKHGSFDEVLEIKLSLEKLGLKVEIAENESTLH
jgi:ATP-dependent Clp protease adaptor protein ClpS